MSSLLQFGGRYAKGKVGLLFQVVKKEPWSDLGITRDVDCDTFVCSQCGEEHSNLYEAFRRPVGMFGCWVVFRYHGAEQVPDLSIPISVERLPKGAKLMEQEWAEYYWHT